MKIVISLLQLAFEFGKPEWNYQKVKASIEEARARGSDIALIPELWASGYDLANGEKYATRIDEGYFAKVGHLARHHRIMIGCSLLERLDGRFYNTFALFGKDGEIVSLYRKIHLFRLLREEKYLTAGDALVFADTEFGKVGLSICYDLRFPELYRLLALDGVNLMLNVAEWPASRIQHWDVLLKARAIENQYFIAAVNKTGNSNGVEIGGHSVILDPWGNEIVAAGEEETVLTGEIDLDDVKKARRWIPVFDDRRSDVYDLNNETKGKNG